MSEQASQFEARLLAYHMGWLSAAEMAEIEAELEQAPELAARSRVLRDSLAPLEDWTSLPAVDTLEAQVLRRVERDGARTAVDAESRLPAVTGGRSGASMLLSFKEVLAVAACIAVLLTLVVPGFARGSAIAQRRLCADNLRQIGSALGSYMHANAGALPFAGPTGGNWLREPTAGVQRLRTSRHRFLLLAQDHLTDAGPYVCPADRQGVVMRSDELGVFDDFAEARNCSYDSQIMLDSTQPAAEDPGLVMYADSNPLFDGAVDDNDPAALNSQVHRGLSGQNVLRLAGAVRWESSPNVGIQNDNIWQIGHRLNYTGRERPQFATDSFMIP